MSFFPPVPPGAIFAFGGATAPQGYLLCDGASLPVADFAELFAAIGYAYGGAGPNFNVPDLRQRFPLGLATAGTGSALGDAGGAIDHDHGGATGSHDHGGATGAHDHGGATGSHDHGGATGSHDHGGATGSHNHGGATGLHNHGGVTGNNNQTQNTNLILPGGPASPHTHNIPSGTAPISADTASIPSGTASIGGDTASIFADAPSISGDTAPISSANPPFLAVQYLIKT